MQQQKWQNRGSLQQRSQGMSAKGGLSTCSKTLLHILFPALQPPMSVWESDTSYSAISSRGEGNKLRLLPVTEQHCWTRKKNDKH